MAERNDSGKAVLSPIQMVDLGIGKLTPISDSMMRQIAEAAQAESVFVITGHKSPENKSTQYQVAYCQRDGKSFEEALFNVTEVLIALLEQHSDK